jgi:ubiquinone/menaquinone biosynthesis C-methylase UbiE
MLTMARAHTEDQGLRNVDLCKGDMTELSFLSDHSVDAVFSTFGFHHLPTLRHLERTCAEVDRVLKPEGGLYLFDFAHLKSEAVMRSIAHRRAGLQEKQFTEDFFHSLRAAFFVDDFRHVTRSFFERRAKLYVTSPLPALVAIKSSRRRDHESSLVERIRARRQALPKYAQDDLRKLLCIPFRRGGLDTPLLD